MKQLVELHGGSIRVHSEGIGKGASFVVLLLVPAAMSARSSRQLQSVEESVMPQGDRADLKRVHVLLVDEDLDARRLLRRILEECGAVAIDVDSVRLAIETIDQTNPHVLVSDLGMPSAYGFELIEVIRSRGRAAQDLLTIALTAFPALKIVASAACRFPGASGKTC